MKKTDFNKNRIASLFVFILGILLVGYYIVVKQRVEFDSDFTDTILWAEAMLTGNGLFDTTMNYAYTLPFGGSLLMAPFVAMFGVGYKAHVLGFLVFFAIFTFSLYKLMRAMDFSVDAAMASTGLILILSLPSKDVRMIMWGHVIHYSLGLLFVVIAMAVYSHIDVDGLFFWHFSRGKAAGEDGKDEKDGKEVEEDKRDRSVKFSDYKWVIILAVITALFCTNGLTTILFFAMPFYGALLIERFINTKDDLLCRANISSAIITCICAVAGMAGFVISKLLQRDVKTVYESMFKDIQMWQNWIWDFEERIRCMLVCAVGEISNDVPMESFTGIRILYMALFGFIIMIVPFVAAFSYKKMQNKIMRMFILSYYVLLFLTLFIYDFSMARGTAHRIVGIYMTAVIVTVVYMTWLIKEKELSRFGILLAIVLTGAGVFSAYGMLSLSGENRYDRLAKVLEENNLKYGYAEYWSAQVTTVLSDSNVVVCPINVSKEGEVTARLYNIRAEQFEDKDDADKYFAFLSAWEYDVTKDSIGAEAAEVIPFDDDGYILVFEENIF